MHPIISERFGILSFQECPLKRTVYLCSRFPKAGTTSPNYPKVHPFPKKTQDAVPQWVYIQEARVFPGCGGRNLDQVEPTFAVRSFKTS